MTESSTQTLISALRELAATTQSEDGVANAAIYEAAERLEQLDSLNQSLSSKSLPRGFEKLDGITHAIFGDGNVRVSDVYWEDDEDNITHAGVSFAPANRDGKVGDCWDNVPALNINDINSLSVVKAQNIDSLLVLKGAIERAIQRLSPEHNDTQINEIKAQAVKEFFRDYLCDVASILDAPVMINGELKDADGDYLHKELVSRRDSYITQLNKGE